MSLGRKWFLRVLVWNRVRHRAFVGLEQGINYGFFGLEQCQFSGDWETGETVLLNRVRSICS